MSHVRCRRFRSDGSSTVMWSEWGEGTAGEGRQSGHLYDVVCAFLSGLPQSRIIAVTESPSPYGMYYVSVYYREEVPVATV